jgi:hypothetical protein
MFYQLRAFGPKDHNEELIVMTRTVAVACLAAVLVVAIMGGCPSKQTAQAPMTPTPEMMKASGSQTGSPGTTPAAGAKTGEALGEQLCKLGVGESGQHVAFTGGSDRFKEKPAGCCGCHADNGRGRKLPQVTIPAINYSSLRAGAKPLYTSDAAVITAVREGKREKGEPLGPMMPRWQLSDTEATAMIGYLKVMDKLPATPEQGKAATPEAKPAAPKS